MKTLYWENKPYYLFWLNDKVFLFGDEFRLAYHSRSDAKVILTYE